jgi:hypothetical protein
MHGSVNASLKHKLLGTLRRLLGTQGLDQRLASLQSEVDALHAQLVKPDGGEQPAGSLQDDITALRVKMEEIGKYQVLPGPPSARYALPLETAPSRHLRPRWGNLHPPITPLLDWISSRGADYQDVLAAMQRHAPQLAGIAREFDAARLPEPGWVGAPCSAFDLAALYTLVAEKRPRRLVEIGSGVAAAFARRSIEDHQLETRITVVDPEPHAGIEAICEKVVRRGLESCDLAVFDALEAGDMVWVDGTHRTFMNSDVTVFMIDVLPRLAPGVLIQVHEIHLPWDYPDRLNNRYWSEAYILAAYLIGARDKMVPVLPSAWVTRGAQFSEWFQTPLVDLGEANGLWRAGAALWFTQAP